MRYGLELPVGGECADPRFLAQLAALAAMALATTTVRLGTTVTALGVGLGDAHDAGFARTGEPVDAKVRAARLDEGLAVLRGL
jgi:alkanesulfonate monooxygenase SsuD/methylene tetrahydromethanopterin reductase-like flavin-dependent oxidoreductase (luciferase family)